MTRFTVSRRESLAVLDYPCLKSQLDVLDEPETNLLEAEKYTPSDVGEACPIIQQLDSDPEKKNDTEID